MAKMTTAANEPHTPSIPPIIITAEYSSERRGTFTPCPSVMDDHGATREIPLAPLTGAVFGLLAPQG